MGDHGTKVSPADCRADKHGDITTMRLLLAEDNRELAHWLEKALVQGGFAVD